ncbi:hypothetical protein [Cyclobacterium plantarum]|uniref:Uncharacterized protein n=1 Tax=Cyclobacterium plantarum TaxID=2716263 RepID=A0ABX0H7M1_9BACT|nr:hypothetical protein [Cyclobacterium plantarum]NHE56417.1 hypothetical protein [Cyclobacterium plantarum]
MNVNVKYKLTIDATVNVDHLKFATKGINKWQDHTSEGYEGRLERLPADADLDIDLLMTGPAGKWKLEVYVRILNYYGNEIDKYRPLNDNGTSLFTNDISIKNSLLGSFLINWQG